MDEGTLSENPTADRLVAIAEAMSRLDHPTKVAASDWAVSALGQRDLVAADRDSEFAVDDWRRCAEHGVLGLMVPERLGGAGADMATTLLTLEGLGHGCGDGGLLYAIVSQMVATQVALAEFGDDDQHERWLRPMLAGEVIGAFGMTEPESGSDAYSLAATAVEQPDGSYMLNGHKSYITMSPLCDVAVVFASTNPAARSWGVSAFVVPMDLAGIERTANREKMGLRTTAFGDLVFRDVRVRASSLLGRPGAGASIFNRVLEVERAVISAPAVGAVERLLDQSIAYAGERHQGGGPIGRYQAVSHRLVDMKVDHETARLFMYRAALAAESGHDAAMMAAMAKLVGSDSILAASLDGVRIHGAKGFVSEFEIDRTLRDVVGGQSYSGTSDIQRNIIARLLGVGS